MEVKVLPIYSSTGEETGSVKLDASVFDGMVNKDALYQAVVAYRANQRKGLAETKTMGEVSGGGRKPWRQKGTGRARVGSIRSPLWRHGGVIFGPHPRDYSYVLPKKIKTLALKSSLNAKLNDNSFMVLDSLTLVSPKTKEAAKIFSHLKIGDNKIEKTQSTLLLLDKINDNLKRALANISFLKINLAKDTHAYEVLSCRKLLITKEALKDLSARIKR